METPRKNLVICPVGDASYHPDWLKGPDRNFDLFLIYYGSTRGRFRDDSEYYLQQVESHSKLERIKWGWETFSARLTQYSAICIPDNDVFTTARGMNRLFDQFRLHDLDWGHPAIAWPCKLGVPLQYSDPFTHVRYVNGTEMLCPVFKRELFLRLLPTFDINRSAWGIDLLWAKTLEGSDAKIGILDDAVFYHLPPRDRWRAKAVSQKSLKDYYQELGTNGVNSQEEFDTLTTGINFRVRDLKEISRKARHGLGAFLAIALAGARFFWVLYRVNNLDYVKQTARAYRRVLGRGVRLLFRAPE
jgi:hypothetical protein